jgi:hypothetical protein
MILSLARRRGPALVRTLAAHRARQAIPSVDVGSFRPAIRRARLALLTLPLLLLGCGVWLVLAPRQQPALPPALESDSGVIVVLDVSESTLAFSGVIGQSLLALGRKASQKAGLVLTSDSAYVALPPQAPGAALAGWQRMIQDVNTRYQAQLDVRDRTPGTIPPPPNYPWVTVFSGGTRLSAGLTLARKALLEAGARHGRVILISDLRDAPEDMAKVALEISLMQREGMKFSVVTIGDGDRQRGAITNTDDASFVLQQADSFYAPASTETLPSKPSAEPLLLLGGAIALVLVLVELLLPPLAWRSSRGAA